MPKTTAQRLNKIVKHLSRQIASDLRAVNAEESAPRLSADESDDFIKRKKARIESLRALRRDMETQMGGD